jgi:hypothetical protein
VRERTFTVAQADAHVPRLERLVERLQRGALALRAAHEATAAELGVEPDALSVERVVGTRPELRRVVEDLDAVIEEVQGLGVELKDLEMGLVDFPAEREGRPIFLCWQFGEDRVRYWHAREEGFAGRRPLPGLPPPPEPQ